jgi:hypothetical protein
LGVTLLCVSEFGTVVQTARATKLVTNQNFAVWPRGSVIFRITRSTLN